MTQTASLVGYRFRDFTNE